VVQRVGEEIVAGPERTVVVDEEFRHQEQRDAAGSRRRIRQAGEHQMDDVVGGVVFAPGDEDLLAEDAVGAVVAAFGAGLQHAEIGAGMRLGQVHRAGPFAGDHFGQIGLLQCVAAVGVDRLGGAHGQRRAERKRHRAGVPHFKRCNVEHMRQRLAAEFF
jgi:hypothetical protein